jgi:hypothetical protein
MMRALKILDEGGMGRFSAFRWPLPASGAPGAWVEESEDTRACVRGIHACLPEQLPTWLGPQLYVIELDGTVTRTESKLVAPRGRLLRRIDGWDDAQKRAYAAAATLHGRDDAVAVLRAEGEPALADRLAACADVAALGAALAGVEPASERARFSLQYLGDAVACAPMLPVPSAYCAAHAGMDRQRFLEARAFQARWLAEALRLDEALTAP